MALFFEYAVTPAQAGIECRSLDSRLRGNDGTYRISKTGQKQATKVDETTTSGVTAPETAAVFNRNSSLGE